MAVSACARNLIRFALIAGLVLFVGMVHWIMTHQHGHEHAERSVETELALTTGEISKEKENVNTNSKSMEIVDSSSSSNSGGSSSSSSSSRRNDSDSEMDGSPANITKHENEEGTKRKKINDLKHEMHEKTLFSSHDNHAAYAPHGEKVGASGGETGGVNSQQGEKEEDKHQNHSQYIPFQHHQHHHDHHVGQHLREIIYPQRFAIKRTVNDSIAHDPHENLNKFHTTTGSALGQSNSKNHTDEVHVTHRPLNSMHAHCHLEQTSSNNKDKSIPKCQSSHAKFVNAKQDEIQWFLEKEDKNELVRHLSIKFINTDATTINRAFDNFMLTRPWWIIKEEPFAWQDGLSLTDETGTHLDSHGALKPHNVVVTYATLSRMKHDLEGRLRLIAGIQFPGEDVCKSVPLAMGRLLDNGWASMMALYGYARKKFSILAPYITKTSKEDEDTIFAPGSMCPNTKNKWNCAFLPSTNCSMPTSVTDCTDTDCLAKALGQEKDGVGSTSVIFFDMKTPQGKLISDNYPKDDHKIPHDVLDSYNRPLNPYQEALQKNFSKFDRFKLKNAIQYDANDIPIKRAPDTNWVTFLYGLLWRHNYQFRSEIGKIIEVVKGNDTKAFEPGFRCTAIHIRRGDRTLENTDMTKYCADRERGKKPDGSPDENNCYVKSTGAKVPCSTISDLGCFAKVPFGSLTLQNYLDKAWELQKTRNVFLMTDATPQWLSTQIKNISSEWNLYTLKSVDRRSSKQGLNFFASVTLARKCGALVGNWFSGVSMLVHESMCFAHGNKMGECPPTWDVGNTHPAGCKGKEEC